MPEIRSALYERYGFPLPFDVLFLSQNGKMREGEGIRCRICGSFVLNCDSRGFEDDTWPISARDINHGESEDSCWKQLNQRENAHERSWRKANRGKDQSADR